MGMLIKNEFYKLKREWFMAFLLLLSLLPILTGGAGAVFNNSTKSLADLFFFMNNQFSMFFPMVIFILIGSLFYQNTRTKPTSTGLPTVFQKRNSFYQKSLLAPLSALALQSFYLLLLVCWWQYSMELVG